MAKLSKLNQYAICWLNNTGKTHEEIAQELSLSVTQVKNFVEKHTFTHKENTSNIKTKQQTLGKITPKDLMITQTSEKSNNSVAIMTKQASELCDEQKKTQQTKLRQETRDGIFRPKAK